MGIALKTKTGISKVYFIELPNDVQQRFHPTPAKTALPRRKREPIKPEGWASAMTNPAAIIKYFVAAITVVVFLIVRRRSQ